MKAWFAALNPRERIIVIGGGTLLIVALLLGSWLSFVKDIERLHDVVSEQRAVNQWMEAAALEATQLRKGGGGKGRVVSSGASLLSLTDQTAKRSGLGNAMTRVEPDGNDKVRIRLERVNFDKMMRWLETLQSKHAVSIDSITVDQHQDSGMANVRLTLKGAG